MVGYSRLRCLFFFQAEDGIRDYKVTGVQTCALPIFPPSRRGDEREMVEVVAPDVIEPVAGVIERTNDPRILRFRLGGDDDRAVTGRSEERRVGKECRSRGWPYH